MPSELSLRQQACVEDAARGPTDEDIAARFKMSPWILRALLSQPSVRLDVSKRREAIRALGMDYGAQPLPMASNALSPPSGSASAGVLSAIQAVGRRSSDRFPRHPAKGRWWRSLAAALLGVVEAQEARCAQEAAEGAA